MAAGDIKDADNTIVEVLTGGDTGTKGTLQHYESGGEYYVCAVEDTGPFAVAIEASADGVESRYVTNGAVEVTLYGSAVKRGSPLEAGLTGGTVQLGDAFGAGKVCGVAAEACDTSGNTFTMWINHGSQ